MKWAWHRYGLGIVSNGALSLDRRWDLPVDLLSCVVLVAGNHGWRIGFIRRPTADLELVRFGGIRLSN